MAFIAHWVLSWVVYVKMCAVSLRTLATFSNTVNSRLNNPPELKLSIKGELYWVSFFTEFFWLQFDHCILTACRFHVCRANSYLCFQFQFSYLVYHVSGSRIKLAVFIYLVHIFATRSSIFMCEIFEQFTNKFTPNTRYDVTGPLIPSSTQTFWIILSLHGCVIITSNIVLLCNVHVTVTHSANSCKEIL